MKVYTTITEKTIEDYIHDIENGVENGNNDYGTVFFGKVAIDLVCLPPDDGEGDIFGDVYLAYAECSDMHIDDTDIPFGDVYCFDRSELPADLSEIRTMGPAKFAMYIANLAKEKCAGLEKGFLDDVPLPPWHGVENGVVVDGIEAGEI